MSSLCKCGTIRTKLQASTSAKFPHRDYYKCDSCGAFDWADGTPMKCFNTITGPECNCCKSSVQRTVKKESSVNRGKRFWCCAAGVTWGCKFFQFCEPTTRKQRENVSGKKRPILPGFATYLSDWKKMEIVQYMMGVDPKFMASYTATRYDDIEVVGLWKISNAVQQEKFDSSKQRIKTQSPKVSSYDIPNTYADQMNQLGTKPLDGAAGEVFLLHGTRPENLHGILFEGLDAALSNNGNFGMGVYFAEHAAKIDQYSTNDTKYQKEGGDITKLHEKIYTRCKHPQNVRYAMVCRVLLGNHVVTSDGRTRLGGGSNIFTTDEHQVLAALENGKIPSSLIGIKLSRVYRLQFRPNLC